MDQPHSPVPDDQLPPEILKSEYQRSLPPRPERVGLFGLPPIPDDILDLAVKYLPWLVLAASIMNAAGALRALGGLTNVNPDFVTGPLTIFGAIVGLAASAAGVMAYFWLSDKAPLGWYLLAAAVALQFLSGLILSGGGTLLGGMIELLITVYVLLQLKERYKS